MKTQSEIRVAFWLSLPHSMMHHYSRKKRQNGYNATIRSAFVDFVDGLQKSGEITEALAGRVTL